MIKPFKKIILAVAVLISSNAHAAAVLVVSPDGKLTGALGVEVNKALYDVSFKDGTCAGLFSACDQLSDFQFTSQVEGDAASQALEAQVFVDGTSGLFDSKPSTTLGCENQDHCAIYTPFAKPLALANVTASKFTNEAPGLKFPDRYETVNVDIQSTTAGTTAAVWAVWTPHLGASTTTVPEPSSLSALGVGIFALARTRRQRSLNSQR